MGDAWKVLFDEKSGELEVARRSRLMSPGLYMSIDRIFINDFLHPEGQNKNDDEFHALARQIATALNCHDDLLTACRHVDSWLMKGYEDKDINNPAFNPAFRRALKHVRAAIAKAESRDTTERDDG